MCGIAGILELDGRPAEPAHVQAITRALAHRGPDGEGIWAAGPIALGHRRLAILDLSPAGEQPMACVDGRYHVTFNGEIYNFLELRRELEGYGHRFHSTSDTEVIGHAFDRWGADCVLRFNGMWSFAVWDTEKRELFLSRDRFGVKPLFYASQPGRFTFASELKAFLHLDGFTARENEDVMKVMLYDPSSFEMLEDTLLLGVRRLQAGHNMTVTATGTRVWRWWRTLDHVPTVAAGLADQAEQFRELFFDACRLRLRSDVPVATCLSGGLDSSSVLCTLAGLRTEHPDATRSADRQAADWQRAFVATFPGTPKDERRYAEVAIAHAGAEARYRPMGPEGVLEDLQQYTYDFENIGGSLLMPLWRIYRELRRDGVVVSLDGHGGDEVLGGYMHYVSDALFRTNIVRNPLRTVDLARTLAPMNGAGPPTTTRLLARRLSHAGPLGDVRSRLRRRPGAPGPVPQPVGLPTSWDSDDEPAIDALGPLNAQLYRAVHHHHLPHILRNFERLSMAHGVEVRMPFMDWRLVCFAFGLPDHSKIGGGFSKRIVREALRGVLPEPVRARRDKLGFSPPMGDWFRGGLGDWVWEQVQAPSFVESTVWDGPAIRDFVGARHRAGEWRADECERVWPFVQAHLWWQTFVEHPPALRAPTPGPEGRSGPPGGPQRTGP